LLANVQFGGIEVDPIPGEPQYLTLAQAQHDDENVSGVQGITVVTSRLQEAASFVDSPDTPLGLPVFRASLMIAANQMTCIGPD
jgi:hypothetical protein